MTPAERAAAVERWNQGVAETRADPEKRAALIGAAYWVSQGDGPRAMPSQEEMERMLDEVLDGPPLILERELEKERRNSNSETELVENGAKLPIVQGD